VLLIFRQVHTHANICTYTRMHTHKHTHMHTHSFVSGWWQHLVHSHKLDDLRHQNMYNESSKFVSSCAKTLLELMRHLILVPGLRSWVSPLPFLLFSCYPLIWLSTASFLAHPKSPSLVPSLSKCLSKNASLVFRNFSIKRVTLISIQFPWTDRSKRLSLRRKSVRSKRSPQSGIWLTSKSHCGTWFFECSPSSLWPWISAE